MRYKNILLIDDDDDDQEIFTSALNEVPNPAQCVAMDNAASALEKLRTEEIIPDVIFLDLNMPIMSGQEFLMQIKSDEQLQYIPVIILSTSSNPDTIKYTKQLGALDFITKPSDYNELIRILGNM